MPLYQPRPRYKWMIGRIMEAFDVAEATVEKFFRDSGNFDMLSSFLEGTSVNRLFVFYQSQEIQNDAGDWMPKSKTPELIFTLGGTDQIRRKAIFFVKNTTFPVNVEEHSDKTLLCGEITNSPLQDLEANLSLLYVPTFLQRTNWGKADKEHLADFFTNIKKFVGDMQENLKSLVGGLKLAKPESKINTVNVKTNINVVAQFETLLAQWCQQIETFLNETQRKDLKDAGPMAELERWRRRMQRLTGITEQLKTKECKTVITVLSSWTKSQHDGNKQHLFVLLRRWKQIDIQLTEAANEAKDNVKYLFTLEKFLEPLYSGTPHIIIETLPVLMNSIKMIHTIARYYNTRERMTDLFVKITNQMIINTRSFLSQNESDLWTTNAEEFVRRLEVCLKLNEAYQEHYRVTKDKLLTLPNSKQFDFDESIIFGRFDLFCRRMTKLIDMFSTIQQFQSLADHKLEGMDKLLDNFFMITKDFRDKGHDLLDYHNNTFDRDYVEFNVRITDLEANLQHFINESFESITSITHSLSLLKKFQLILHRDSLKSDLDNKFTIIFQTYGMELQQVQNIYERNKHSPPIARNLPPVAGNITWSRHLLKRIEEPMKNFESNQNVLNSKEAKRIIKTYNKVARTLVAFEYLWYQAWIQSIDTAKAGLQATLIIRHPEDQQLYVNFDQEILQLIREAKCLDRMGIVIPESAKIVLVQEAKFKSYYNDLLHVLREYKCIAQRVAPVYHALLSTHFKDMDYKLRPGMITLTWTSMNIDAYKHHIHAGLQRLDELVTNVNDITEHRINANLKFVSRCTLMDLSMSIVSLETFVKRQDAHIEDMASLLQGKNIEIETAVDDLLGVINSYPLERNIAAAAKDNSEDAKVLKQHYNNNMYQALLKATKKSLNVLKKRVGSHGTTGFLVVDKPFFEVDVGVSAPSVLLEPSLNDIQKAINKAAKAVLGASKRLFDWNQHHFQDNSEKKTFFSRITKDIEIACVVLLLTGSIQGTRTEVSKFVNQFSQYDWLWKDDMNSAYCQFIADKPSLDDYAARLGEFEEIADEIRFIPPVHNVGALQLRTQNLKTGLIHQAIDWTVLYSSKLHSQAYKKLEILLDYILQAERRLQRQVNDLNDLRSVMDHLKDIRDRESGIQMEISPVMDMYRLLEKYLPQNIIQKEEMDARSMLMPRWRGLTERAEQVTDQLNLLQLKFKRQLLKDVRDFKDDVSSFRMEYLSKGPMASDIMPMQAVERLTRFKEEFVIRDRKFQLYRGGEELFALPLTEYPELETTRSELRLLQKLYDLYVDVIDTSKSWNEIRWIDFQTQVAKITERIEMFAVKCRRMPPTLREWPAYNHLSKQIKDFQIVLPLLQELCNDCIKPRHWKEVMKVCGTTFHIDSSEMLLSELLDAHLENQRDAVEDICESAEKQQTIEIKLREIKEQWDVFGFQFTKWKTKSVPILAKIVPVMEDLEDAQMNLQAMLTMRHIAPFRLEAQVLLASLSETSDTLERWVKVQMLWCSLESVFTGGDIAKQLPMEAKKFSRVDKDWVKIMLKASSTVLVVPCCANELLQNALPVMYSELEKCQKSLEGYLEQKRCLFPRFYFVSNPVLLQILSQGSNPIAIQPFYEKIFDSISLVEHEDVGHGKMDIVTMVCLAGQDSEQIPLRKSVKPAGNIEHWLDDLRVEQQHTIKNLMCRCATQSLQVDPNVLRKFVDISCAQFALLGFQFIWTQEMQFALEECKTNKKAMLEAKQKTIKILSTVSSWCLTDLGSKLNRKKIETLVTIQVHQRDVTDKLVSLYQQKKIRGAESFDWLKQARFYYSPEKRDHMGTRGSCTIYIADVEFEYQHEYLGVKERLVVTPLTDRCYITLSQAMGMFYGGAPAGPAGTGKTETVKDLGRTLGLYVVVTNCTDQMRYHHCAKIFKGLCGAGLWGCFDEFNRITLPVLSVVAQQVQAIMNAKKGWPKIKDFTFPGEANANAPQIVLKPICGIFITMNPGYAGRQELPENLKALFRGVAMMVPDREIIIKVKLCSAGYSKFALLSRKFHALYSLCEEQLSNQRHYDFGLRNVLSVLRTAGATKRQNINDDETLLLYRTLRDMNLSKLVSQDVPLFLSLLTDLFPESTPPPNSSYPEIEHAVNDVCVAKGLIQHESWLLKVTQFYETTRVRHGIMLSGAAGGGKSTIIRTLQSALHKVTGSAYKLSKLNPKSMKACELYGQVEPMSGEWTTGVFAAMWAKFNQRTNKFTTWILCDGPVDAIWIEDLNTVLDDNRILTLANGDRIPMTENVLVLFENENLNNASPATVSRTGIIYVSTSDLGWYPVVQAWIQNLKTKTLHEPLQLLFKKYVGVNTQYEAGHLFEFLKRNTKSIMKTSHVGVTESLCHLLGQLLVEYLSNHSSFEDAIIERLFLYSLVWSVGGILAESDRAKFGEYLRDVSGEEGMVPDMREEGDTIYEYFVDTESLDWDKWAPLQDWEYPHNGLRLNFSNLLVPTMDSTRAIFILQKMAACGVPVLMVGDVGTAKTSTATMFLNGLDQEEVLVKQINFSSVTTPRLIQTTIESELDKRGGKNFGPMGGKRMHVFFDDMSMPVVNDWGDQPTLEIVRQLIEDGGFCFLDKDKRGDFKVCEDLKYLGCMQHPGGGRNDIPSRLKRHFFMFNVILPAVSSINDIFGQMLEGRFEEEHLSPQALHVVSNLTTATIELWDQLRRQMLPTPAKFHYIFNLRDLSRVFQGILLTPMEVIRTGGSKFPDEDDNTLVRLWYHECERVMCDKLTNNADKDKYTKIAIETATEVFGETLAEQIQPNTFFVNFFRDVSEAAFVLTDEDDLKRPKVYEPTVGLKETRDRVDVFLHHPERGYNARNPAYQMNLVLFDDALRHLICISRVICMPRGSCLLVGVGGSGKQSLTRLAVFIAEQSIFQITLTKSYGPQTFRDDLRKLFVATGEKRRDMTFLFTDTDIKDESFLESINSILLTGEVTGLFSKEEYLAMCADLGPSFQKDHPNAIESPAALKAYFRDQVRDNLHIVLCMSPMNPLFAFRARRFPALISCCTIDWFLPWPQEALTDVSRGFIDVEDFHVEASNAVKEELIKHMGYVHTMVTDRCDEYYTLTKRRVYQTPKSYLFFIQEYKNVYSCKLAEVQDKEARTNLGLQKLIQGGQDVEAMKTKLAEEEEKLKKATQETESMLSDLRESSAIATMEGDKVAKFKAKCLEDAERIGREKAACEKDLARAQPFVDKALAAIDSIEPAHIAEIKRLAKPACIIRLVFDCVLLLFKKEVESVNQETLLIAKQNVAFLSPSYSHAQALMSDASFLQNLFHFGTVEKDLINEETIELLEPYMELKCPDGTMVMNSAIARKASMAAEGLCTWAIAMTEYHGASKMIKPKLEALSKAEANLALANKNLDEATKRFNECAATLKKLQDQFEMQMATKRSIEEGLQTTETKMTKAENLISGLSAERARWEEDQAHFAEVKEKLVGDCAIACAFLSYCGPFNKQYRRTLIGSGALNANGFSFTSDLVKRKIPVSSNLDVISFLVDEGKIGDWQLQGLPSDPLSIQNGILITRNARFPLIVDPQNQALTWLLSREAERLPYPVIDMADKQMKEFLEYALGEGNTLIISVEESIDLLLDPILEKRIQKKGKSSFIMVGDKKMDYNSNFSLMLISRLPNPQFSPELQAKTTLIDFTVTQKGLEEQLLADVIQREQKELEEQLNIVVEQVTQNTKTLLKLDNDLLQRLTSNDGNLLDDDELVGVLKNVKDTAEDVKKKLQLATETKSAIQVKREQYRPVATRGAVMYFSIVDMSNVNVMYQTSLKQFQKLFQQSFEVAESSNVLIRRVGSIIETMTYLIYRYINRGLYEKDRLVFVFIIATKLLIAEKLIHQGDMDLFMRGGAALNINDVITKPFDWMSDTAWLNAIVLMQQIPTFKTLSNDIRASEAVWKKWYEDNSPEMLPIPGYEQQIKDNKEVGPYLRLSIVRALRVDRTLLCMTNFIRSSIQLGPRYVDPVTDTIETVYDESNHYTPIVFLLSTGADPTEAIEHLAKRKKTTVECISMGEGQGVIAMRAMQNAWVAGTWVLLQNCELGLDLMMRMEKIIQNQEAHENYRLMITAAPHRNFPYGLLQISTKIANEPPSGLRAGLLRSFTTMIDQDKLERIESSNWRRLLHTLCFIHSVVQERRKFGPLGWNIPYEFNTGDLSASITFLEKHLFDNEISWETVQYMISQVQYGGKITDEMDMRLFKTYAEKWLSLKITNPDFKFNPSSLIQPASNDFVYRVLDDASVEIYREYSASMPRIDSPEIIGLHPNADMTFRMKDVTEMLKTLSSTKPKGSNSTTPGRDTDVYNICRELLGKMPPDFVVDVYMEQIKKMGGLNVPLNIFLFQEVQRLQTVIERVRATMVNLQLAITGEVVLTEALVDVSGDIFDARVPKSWIYTVSGNEFSWILPTLGLWFSSLYRRHGQYAHWLQKGRPRTYWMAGFFNPQGFLTTMKQEVTRMDRSDKWALDDVTYHTEVTSYMNADRIKDSPKEGVYIDGFFLEGGRWNADNNCVSESLPKVLFASMPVIYVTASISQKRSPPREPYKCPCYKYRIRQDRFHIFNISLPCGARKPAHWILRGVAILCSTD